MAVEKIADYKVNIEKLMSFGFVKQQAVYQYQQSIVDGQFQLVITTDETGILQTKVVDTADNVEYVLHLQPDADGKFVSKVRQEYQDVLDDIKTQCYETNIFQTPQAQMVIKFVEQTYDNQLEFLWKKFPKNAIWRRTDTKKWYALLMIVPGTKLGLDSDEDITVLGLREKPETIEKLVDNQKYFPGYHMSKKNWYTIILDRGISDSEIMKRIAASYALATK